jgi:hypothetical protein
MAYILHVHIHDLGLIRNYSTRLCNFQMDKHSSLFFPITCDKESIFYNIDTNGIYYKITDVLLALSANIVIDCITFERINTPAYFTPLSVMKKVSFNNIDTNGICYKITDMFFALPANIFSSLNKLAKDKHSSLFCRTTCDEETQFL